MNYNKSKICIITTYNIFNAPCLVKYQNLIEEPFDIIYWDRCEIEEECGAEKYFRYRMSLPTDAKKKRKYFLFGDLCVLYIGY